MSAGAILAVLAAVCLGGCRTVQLEDEYDPSTMDMAVLQCFVAAPIVVVGEITQVEQIGGTRPARKAPSLLLDPVRITISVEHALRGRVPGNPLEVLAFRYNTTKQGVYGNPFIPRGGQHRLFLLRRDGGHLRPIVDGAQEWFAPLIYTGEHRDMDPALLRDPGKAMSFILLTPAEGADLGGFFSVRYNAAIAMAVTHDKAWVISLLRSLTRYPKESIREEARWEIGVVESDRWGGPTANTPCPVRLE